MLRRTSRLFARAVVAAAVTVSVSLIGTGIVAGPAIAADGGGGTPVIGTTYYLDSTSGSDSNSGTSPTSAWATLSKASSMTFQPGDQLELRSGETWTGQLALHGSGDAGSPIVVTSYGSGAKPIIAGSGQFTSAVLLSNEHDVTVNGLEVTNTNGAQAWRNGIEITAKDAGALPGISVLNNYVHNIDGITTPTTNTSATVSIGHGGILVDILGNITPTYFTGMSIENNEVSNVPSYGIVTWSTWFERDGRTNLWTDAGVPQSGFGAYTPSTGLVIRSNNVHDIGNGGISPNEVSGAIIEYNTVARTAQNHSNAAIWWSQADNTLVQYNDVSATVDHGLWLDDTAFDSDQSTYNSVVQYNFSHDNGGGFFMTCSFNTGPAEAIVRDNISQNDGGANGMSIDLSCYNQKQVYIYNNTIYGGSSTLFMLGEYTPVTNTVDKGVVVHDNIFVNRSNATWHGSQDVQDVTYWHNLYSGGPVPPDAAAVTGDPKFVAPGAATSWTTAAADYQLQSGSPAIGAGDRVPGDGGHDFVGGALLPQGYVDLGALQFAAIHPNVTSSYASNAQPIVSLVDGDPSTSWASSAFTPGGTISINYPSFQPVDAITIGTAFGMGQGITSVTVQTQNGTTGAWSNLATANLVWYSNTSLVEYRTIQLPSIVSSGQIRLVVNGANTQWGHFAINQIRLDATTSLPPTVNSDYSTQSGQLSNLVDGVPTTNWAAVGSSVSPYGGFSGGWIGLQLPTATTVSTLTVSAAFGLSQGVTNVSVMVLNGSNQVSFLSNVPLTWSTNSAAVETRTIALPTPGPTTRVVVFINSTANGNTASNFSLNGLSVS